MSRLLLLTVAVACLGCAAPTRQKIVARSTNVMWDVNSDHFNYYTPRSLGALAVGTGFAAALANTPADRHMHEFYQDSIRNSASDQVSSVVKPLGDGRYVIPAYLAASMLGEFTECGPLDVTGEWGERCWRTTLVGAPSLLFLQAATGAGRPNEYPVGSTWQPFQDNNGVSGHTFMGAIPFLSAAKMTDNPWLKAGCYAGSTAVGWSRINDDAHYTSQVVLGWWIAFLASNAVDGTCLEKQGWSVQPMQVNDGAGALITLQY